MAAFVDFNRTALNRNGAAGFTAILICLSQGVALGGGRQAVRLKAVGERLKAVRLLGRKAERKEESVAAAATRWRGWRGDCFAAGA